MVAKFFVGGSLLAYSIAASQTEIDTKYWSKQLVSVSHRWTLRPPTTEEMRKAQYLELGKVRFTLFESPP